MPQPPEQSSPPLDVASSKDDLSPNQEPLPRRDRERLLRRRGMLSAARQVFADRGFAGATLEEIASRAEYGKGTLYNYFPDGKDEILFAVFEELYDELVLLIKDSFPEGSPEVAGRHARRWFSDFIEASFVYFDTHQDLFLILAREAHRMCLSDNPERVAFFVSQRARVTSALAEQVTRAVDAGVMRPFPANAVADVLIGNIHGVLMHRALARCNPELDAARKRSGESDEPASGGSPSAVDVPLGDIRQSARFLTSILFDGLLTHQAQPPYA